MTVRGSLPNKRIPNPVGETFPFVVLSSPCCNSLRSNAEDSIASSIFANFRYCPRASLKKSFKSAVAIECSNSDSMTSLGFFCSSAAAALSSAAYFLARTAGESKATYARALRCARAGVEDAPPDGVRLRTLGMALYRAGDLKAAADTLERADTANVATDRGAVPSNVIFLAMTYARLGRRDDARTTLARARTISEQPKFRDRADVAAMLAEADRTLSDAESEIPASER